MESLACPRCGADMLSRSLGLTNVSQCPDGHGVFLDRADLGTLIEAETDFHAASGPATQPLPRITSDMATPPSTPVVPRAFVETLFG